MSEAASGDRGPDVQQFLKSQPRFLRELIAGGLAGAIDKTSVAPLERTKILFQTGGVSMQQGVPGTVLLLWRNEGFSGLFKGNGASVLRIVPYAAIHFGTYEWYRRLIVENLVPHVGSTHSKQTQAESASISSLNSTWSSSSGGSASASSKRSSLHRQDSQHGDAHSSGQAGITPSGGRYDDTQSSGQCSQLGSHHDSHISMSSMGESSSVTSVLPASHTASHAASLTASQAASCTSSCSHSASEKIYRVVGLQADASSGPTTSTTSTTGNTSSISSSSTDSRTEINSSTSISASIDSRSSSSSFDSGQQRLLRHTHINPLWDLVAGSCAGTTAVALTYPLDLIRARLAWVSAGIDESTHQKPAQGGVPSSSVGRSGPTIRAVVKEVVQCEGVLGLYRGMAPTLLGILPYAGIKFYVYQSLKVAYRDSPLAKSPEMKQGGTKLPLYVMLSCGAISGIVAQTLTYPLDVIRRRMQVRSLAGAGAVVADRVTTISTFKAIVSEHGFRGLFRGLSINYIKVVPSTAIGFTVYDYMKNFLGVRGNL